MDFKKLRQICIKETNKKIKQSVEKDSLLMQASNNISETDKVMNTQIKRLREWYELYNPEFSKSCHDHKTFLELIISKKDQKQKDSMGADLSKEDLKPILELVHSTNQLFDLRKQQGEYLENVMQSLCPNVKAVAGSTTGAKLIALAGSLEKLAKIPASKIQLFGAEKALFRHIKTGARPPKHGIIHEHPIVSRVSMKEKGKAARALADKVAIAAKIDYFKGKFIGDKLRKELEKRFK